jgi:hypothetical protein
MTAAKDSEARQSESSREGKKHGRCERTQKQDVAVLNKDIVEIMNLTAQDTVPIWDKIHTLWR